MIYTSATSRAHDDMQAERGEGRLWLTNVKIVSQVQVSWKEMATSKGSKE